VSFYELPPDFDAWKTGHWGDDANPEEEPERLTLEDRADLARDRAEERGEY